MNLKHTRHRSPVNFLVELIAALTPYSRTKGEPKKLFISTCLSIVEVVYHRQTRTYIKVVYYYVQRYMKLLIY